MLHRFSAISVASYRKKLGNLVCKIIRAAGAAPHNGFVTDLPFNQSQFESVTSVVTSVRDTVDGVSA